MAEVTSRICRRTPKSCPSSKLRPRPNGSRENLGSMITLLLYLLRLLPFLCGGDRQLTLKNLALRQHLAVYEPTVARPTLRATDRLFRVGLSRVWELQNVVGDRGSQHDACLGRSDDTYIAEGGGGDPRAGGGKSGADEGRFDVRPPTPPHGAVAQRKRYQHAESGHCRGASPDLKDLRRARLQADEEQSEDQTELGDGPVGPLERARQRPATGKRCARDVAVSVARHGMAIAPSAGGRRDDRARLRDHRIPRRIETRGL